MTPPTPIVTDLEHSRMLKEAEEWRTIEGYEGLYEVSNLGRVRRWYKNTRNTNKNGKSKLLSPCNRGRYLCVVLSKNDEKHMFIVSRLVAKAFIPNPRNKSQVNHKDGNKTNNAHWNLEWVTPSENTQHAVDTGLRARVQGVALHSMNGRPPWNKGKKTGQIPWNKGLYQKSA